MLEEILMQLEFPLGTKVYVAHSTHKYWSLFVGGLSRSLMLANLRPWGMAYEFRIFFEIQVLEMCMVHVWRNQDRLSINENFAEEYAVN